ncbi:MAG TPA: glycosyltransferase family 4 protein [Pyrinomonadaceae bacterium]|nr:glycosyltransferase family 4 protein [Pyrinomonadaceae bacterium]
MVATAQHLTDLATSLSARGHDVTVVASDRGYDDPTARFARCEQWNDIEIIRIRTLSLGKGSRGRRAFNFGSFLLICGLRLLLLPRFDVVIALTSPPLISFLATLFVKLKGGRLYSWVMDLNPDEAIAAGWLEERSPTTRFLQRLSNYSFHNAARTIVLDRFMKERVVAKGVDPDRLVIIPPWAHDDQVSYSEVGREAFRRQHDLSDKFVVMYSGNHSPCHSLDTLLDTALALQVRPEIVFCFVGGGSEQVKVREFAASHSLQNVKCLPYQPLSQLSSSLSAADLHVVVMGEKFVGIVHPCKVYNIMLVGAPALYIGPQPSHITDIATQDGKFFLTRHGDVESVTTAICQYRNAVASGARHPEIDPTLPRYGTDPAQASLRFSKQVLLPQLIGIIEQDVHDFSGLRDEVRAGGTF